MRETVKPARWPGEPAKNGAVSADAQRKNGQRGFTLLEVCLAIAIMALVGTTICRFVVTEQRAIRTSMEDSAEKGAMQSLVAVLTEELRNLPPDQPTTLKGEAHKFNGKDSDEMEWITAAGNGLFTQAAAGSWKVRLILRPQEESNTYTLGMLRQLPDNSSRSENWLPLLPNVDAIQVRYYDPGLNDWLEAWSGGGPRPSLVRVRIWRTSQTVPYEAVIELPPKLLATNAADE